MNESSISDLKLLDYLLKKFYNIIKQGNPATTSYAKNTIEIMCENISVALNHKEESLDVFPVLRSFYSSMFPAKSGLSEFYIWNNDFHVRKKLNMEYEEVKQQIESILSKYTI